MRRHAHRVLHRGAVCVFAAVVRALVLVATLLPSLAWAGETARDAAPSVSAAPSGVAPFAGVVLEDPQERDWDLSALRGHAVLLVVADRSASGASVEWGRRIAAARPQAIALWATPGKVTVVSVADLRAVPSLARSSARWIIARMVGDHGPGGPPLLLDWDGIVAGRIGVEDGVPNVWLYAADGSLVLRDAGEATADRIERLATAIDALSARRDAKDADDTRAEHGGDAAPGAAPTSRPITSDEVRTP